MADRYNQPSRVEMYVMSVSQQAFGLSARNTRRSKLGEALVLRESVVTLNRRIALGMI
jgi:hypothetical protein